MLPLWIIDITLPSTRRDAFQRLVGQIEHVYMPNVQKDEVKDEKPLTVAADLSPNSLDTEMHQDNKMMAEDEHSIIEAIDREEKQKAAKKAKLKGDYWYYSQIDDCLKDVIQVPNGLKETEKNADLLYKFQEELVKEAKAFIHTLRKSNSHPYQSINIAVIGDATQMFTRYVFASIAVILQKEKGRFLATHIHQGMSIVGFLYAPCDINSLDVKERASILRLFKEIEVQHDVPAIRGYDHMMIYQNVQNRTECAYSMLDDEQLAQYLLQCFVHMYLACNDNHPLIDGTSSDDTFYFSMGAASVYFDMAVEDEKDTFRVARDLLSSFMDESSNCGTTNNYDIVDPQLYSADNVVKEFSSFIRKDINLDDVEQTDPSPHPISNFLQKRLKRLYYNYYLRFYPAALMRNISARIEDATGEQLDDISNKSNNSFKTAAIGIQPGLAQIIAKVNENDGSLSYIEYSFKKLQEVLSKEKELIREKLQSFFWIPLLEKTIDENKKDHFEEYHNAYLADSASKNGGAGCAMLKTDVQEKLQSLLGSEKTFAATIVRCFLLGILCVLAILPVLDLVSPLIIDLGNVRKHAHYWALGIFLIPTLVQFISYLLYLRKRAVCLRILKAYYIHDAYARLANRVESEAGEFYDKMINLCEEYLKRCRQIRKEIRIPDPKHETKMTFPTTMFNQPLNGGKFDDDEIIPANEVEESRIKVNYQPRGIGHLTKAHHYLLINRFNDEFAELFKEVKLLEPHAHRFDEETGEYVFVSKDEQIKHIEDTWNQLKSDFVDHLFKGIKEEMLPREFPTVGDKIMQYRRKIDQLSLLYPLIRFASTNGEVICEADTEYADIKINKDIHELTSRYLPLLNTRIQVSPYTDIYKKYLFVTRWKSFEHFSYNRIFPTEDFDLEIREVLVAEEENKAKDKKKREEAKRYGNSIKDEAPQAAEETPYVPILSSLLLWAVCPDENSSVWMRLFEKFGRAYEDRMIYRKVLNQEN